MADTKLSELTELAAAPAVDDEIYIRDVSEAAISESKRITIANLLDGATKKATLTTTGDMYYASGASTPARLAIGATDTLFSVQGGIPTWRTPANILTDLSGQAGATFSFNSQDISGVGTITPPGADGQDLGATSTEFRSLYIGDAGKIYFGLGQEFNLAKLAASGSIAAALGLGPDGAHFRLTGENRIDFVTTADTDYSAMRWWLEGATDHPKAFVVTHYKDGAATHRHMSFYTQEAALNAAPIARFDIDYGVDPCQIHMRYNGSAGYFDMNLNQLKNAVLGTALTLNGQIFDAGAVSAYINTTGGGQGLTLTSTQDGDTGATLTFRVVSASPAAGDVIADIYALGKNSTPTSFDYGHLFIKITDPTATSEDSRFDIQLVNAGADNLAMTLSGAGLGWFDVGVNVDEYYQVAGTQVVGARVVDARCDDAINSGDATTDGVIDALRDAMITHGLIAAA